MPAISTGLRLSLNIAAVSRAASSTSARIGVVKVQLAVPLDQFVGHLDLAVNHVAMDFDIAGALLRPNRAHHFMQFMRGAARIGEHRARRR